MLQVEFGENPLFMETGRMARQAFSVVAQVGGTVVMANVTRAKSAKAGQDFFPLMVDYREKYYAAGRIPGGFFKRETRPTDRETLRARLIDRPLRPLFPEGFKNEVQVYVTVLSFDGQNTAEMVGMNAASAALLMSDVPFAGPVAGVRIGLIGDELILNPTNEQMNESALDLVVAGTKNALTMVECGANELGEDIMIEALDMAQEAIRAQCEAQEAFAKKVGVPKMVFIQDAPNPELLKAVKSAAKKPLTDTFKIHAKNEREEAVEQVAADLAAKLVSIKEDGAADKMKLVKSMVHDEYTTLLRQLILNKGMRNDGRATDQVRNITVEVGVLPRTHGTALFTRGETQSLTVLTVGTSDDEQMIDSLHGTSYRKFFLHYNFPAYSVGEVRPPRGPGRREIGHGALAERALLPILPTGDSFPYTLRIVSEILESNGSSSMATVCAGTLALMDGGVPIKAPVAGIAMGLILEGDDYAILSDINGSEDHLGDMDFKVAGTKNGITALQMDIKIEGITLEIMTKALEQARRGRLHILGEMAKGLAEPREEMSAYAPRIVTTHVSPDKIREIIGPGGKVIQGMEAEFGVKITVLPDGTVMVASADPASVKGALERIENMTKDAEVGKIYTGKVVNIMAFGAFVEIMPGKDGLVHISELENYRVDKVEDVVKLGDVIQVKCIAVEDNGKVRLSRKALLEGGAPSGGGKPPRGGNDDQGGEDNGGGDDRGGSRGGERGDRGGDRGGRGGRDRGPRFSERAPGGRETSGRTTHSRPLGNAISIETDDRGNDRGGDRGGDTRSGGRRDGGNRGGGRQADSGSSEGGSSVPPFRRGGGSDEGDDDARGGSRGGGSSSNEPVPYRRSTGRR